MKVVMSANIYVGKMTLILLNMLITHYPTIIDICVHKRKFRKFLPMLRVYFLRHIFVIDPSMFSIFIKEKPLSSDCRTSFIVHTNAVFRNSASISKLFSFISLL